MNYKLISGSASDFCSLAALGLFGLSPAHADVTMSGFSNNTVNTQGTYTSVGSVGVSNNDSKLTLTDGGGFESSNAFNNVLVPFSNGFTASFTYQDIYPAGYGSSSDGFAFVLQNDGLNVLGGQGGDLGICRWRRRTWI